MVIVTKDRKSHIQKSEFDKARFLNFFSEIVKDTEIDFDNGIIETIKEECIDYIESLHEIEAVKLFDVIIRYTNDKIDQNNPKLTYLSASALRRKLYKDASKQRGYYYRNQYGDYLNIVVKLIEMGIYDDCLLVRWRFYQSACINAHVRYDYYCHFL